MQALKGNKLDIFPVSGLEWLRDLMSFEGPLLSEYAHPHGDRYLYCWCECDESATRWMVLRVAESTILRLASGFIPLDFVIPTGCNDDFVYFVDIAARTNHPTCTLSRITDIPAAYYPEKGVFLDSAEGEGEDSYPVMLDGDWLPTELFQFPKDFEQAYSFLYAHRQLRMPSRSLPWRGNFSAMHFDRWVKTHIPRADRLAIKTVQLASPGFIRFTADRGIAASVAAAIATIDDRRVKATYKKLSEYISNEKLRDLDLLDPGWPAHDRYLSAMTKDLAGEIGSVDADFLLGTAPRIFEAAQILRWFCLRLMRMSILLADGAIQFSPPHK